ncbi:MAG: substrate-binding domain-containing protein [Caldilineaceae bacterium]|nr:substrate-binding domain-containing protein [Caldilineaceae bacterium]MCB9118921.1 substrate-binding domain-containing protein [Caldilineaceae bacterium]
MSLLLGACAPAAAPATPADDAAAPAAGAAEAKKDFYFVYVPKLVHPWYEDVKNGADRAIAELAERGITVKYDWDAPPTADVVQQTQRLEAAIGKKPDVLFVSCLDVAADKPLIEEAVAQGVPVIGFDTPCPDTPLTSFVGHEAYVQDGADLAEVLAKAMDYSGEVGILLGSPGAENHKQRVEGFKAALAQYPDIQIVAEEYDNDDLERAVNLTASMIQAHPNLKGVFGANASAPIGAGRAIVEAGKKGEILLVGMDDLPEMVEFIRDGTALAMSVQAVPEIGYWSIMHAVALAGGQTTPVVHDTGSLVVDQSNLDSYKGGGEAKKDFYFVYVPKLVHPWYEDVKNGADRAIAELAERGITVKYDWDAPPTADVVQQTQRLEAAIGKKPDVLFVSCLDVAADKPLIEEAVAQGVPVIGFDTPCPDTPLTSFVGHEAYVQDGADLAEVLAKAMDYSGEVGILLGSPGAENHKQRVEGFKAALAQYPDIQIVAEEYDNDDLERAVNLTASMIQAHPNLKGVFGANASAPIGAGRAIVEAGKKGEILLVGMDDLPEMVEFIRDGTALAMSVQAVPEIGYWTVMYGTALAGGQTTPVVHDTGSLVVDQSNLDSYK